MRDYLRAAALTLGVLLVVGLLMYSSWSVGRTDLFATVLSYRIEADSALRMCNAIKRTR